MELERILQSQGFGSRKRCRMLVRAGRFAVNGVVCENPFTQFATEELVFSVDGVEWRYRQPATAMLHKPADYECSRQPIHHPSVYSLLPLPLLERGMQSVGRLDEDTTGLLILTDDGQLNHRLTSPKAKLPKAYRVGLKHPLVPSFLDSLRNGVMLHDENDLIRAVDCVALDERSIRLVITEGRYHQVKRMVAAAGNRVEALHREAVGCLSLPDDLPVGQWRWLEAEDLAKLAGGTNDVD